MPVLTVPLGLIMLVAAWPKIVLPYEFLSDLYAYQLAGRELGVLAAMILPWMELCVGLCLLLNIFRSGALLAAIALASSFVVAQGWVLYHGLQISCGCFGGASEMVGWFSFFKNMPALSLYRFPPFCRNEAVFKGNFLNGLSRFR